MKEKDALYAFIQEVSLAAGDAASVLSRCGMEPLTLRKSRYAVIEERLVRALDFLKFAEKSLNEDIDEFNDTWNAIRSTFGEDIIRAYFKESSKE